MVTTINIAVSEKTHERLRKRGFYQDTMDNIVSDLLDKVEQIEK